MVTSVVLLICINMLFPVFLQGYVNDRLHDWQIITRVDIFAESEDYINKCIQWVASVPTHNVKSYTFEFGFLEIHNNEIIYIGKYKLNSTNSFTFYGCSSQPFYSGYGNVYESGKP